MECRRMANKKNIITIPIEADVQPITGALSKLEGKPIKLSIETDVKGALSNIEDAVTRINNLLAKNLGNVDYSKACEQLTKAFQSIDFSGLSTALENAISKGVTQGQQAFSKSTFTSAFATKFNESVRKYNEQVQRLQTLSQAKASGVADTAVYKGLDPATENTLGWQLSNARDLIEQYVNEIRTQLTAVNVVYDKSSESLAEYTERLNAMTAAEVKAEAVAKGVNPARSKNDTIKRITSNMPVLPKFEEITKIDDTAMNAIALPDDTVATLASNIEKLQKSLSATLQTLTAFDTLVKETFVQDEQKTNTSIRTTVENLDMFNGALKELDALTQSERTEGFGGFAFELDTIRSSIQQLVIILGDLKTEFTELSTVLQGRTVRPLHTIDADLNAVNNTLETTRAQLAGLSQGGNFDNVINNIKALSKFRASARSGMMADFLNSNGADPKSLAAATKEVEKLFGSWEKLDALLKDIERYKDAGLASPDALKTPTTKKDKLPEIYDFGIDAMTQYYKTQKILSRKQTNDEQEQLLLTNQRVEANTHLKELAERSARALGSGYEIESEKLQQIIDKNELRKAQLEEERLLAEQTAKAQTQPSTVASLAPESLASIQSVFAGLQEVLDKLNSTLVEMFSPAQVNAFVQALQQGVVSASSLNDAMTDKEENEGLATLAQRIHEIIELIDAKVKAYQESDSAMSKMLDNEIQRLTVLSTTLNEIYTGLLAIAQISQQAPLSIAFGDTDVQSVQSLVRALGKLGQDDKIGNSLGNIAEYIRMFAEDINNIKVDNSVLSSLDSLLSRGEELKALATVLHQTVTTAQRAAKSTAQNTNKTAKQIQMLVQRSSAQIRLLTESPRGVKYTQPVLDKVTELTNALAKLKTYTDGNGQLNAGLDINAKDIQSAADAVETLVREIGQAGYKNNVHYMVADIDKAEKSISDIADILHSKAVTPALRKELSDLSDQFANVMKTGGSQAELDDLINKLSKYKTLLKSSEYTLSNLGQQFLQRLNDANSRLLAQYFSWQDIIRYMRQAFTNMVELNSQFVELSKVSDVALSDLIDDFSTYADAAIDLKSTISDMVSATADWSRNGYNLPDAQELAKVALLYKNVGDGIDIDTANKSLISTLRGFKLEAQDAMSIVDSFNEVANNFPIDSNQIGQALQRSAAAFSAANTSLQESIAIVTATNSVVQNADKVGNAWTTVAARIRGTKQTLEELGEETDAFVESTSKMRDTIKTLTGVDILEKDQKTYKSIYEIMLGIGKVWDKLSDVEQAGLLEALAGKILPEHIVIYV